MVLEKIKDMEVEVRKTAYSIMLLSLEGFPAMVRFPIFWRIIHWA